MVDGEVAHSAILKILSGVQSGVEVSLPAGQYTLGSGPEDDIQLIDVSLAPGHAALRIGPSGIQLRAAAGSVRTANGIALEPGSDWQEIEPLDILTAGTTRLALGPASALWTSIADADVDVGAERAAAGDDPSFGRLWAEAGQGASLRRLVLPIIALLMISGVAIAYLTGGESATQDAGAPSVETVKHIRAALSALPFAHDVVVEQEVDGAVYVTGHVDTQVERRAVAGAVEAAYAAANLRVWVLESIRQEIGGLVAAKGLGVTFGVSGKGAVTLEGYIPDDREAREFTAMVATAIPGVASVDETRLRTPSTLLEQANAIADSAQIRPWVMLRLDANVIEATGALPVDKIDAWSGFLRVYARRLAGDVGLRSFVQLQDVTIAAPAGPSAGAPASAPAVRPSPAIVIGGARVNDNDIVLDVDRLLQGDFAPDEVLMAGRRAAEGNAPRPASAERNTILVRQAAPARQTAPDANDLSAILRTIENTSTVFDIGQSAPVPSPPDDLAPVREAIGATAASRGGVEPARGAIGLSPPILSPSSLPPRSDMQALVTPLAAGAAIGEPGGSVTASSTLSDQAARSVASLGDSTRLLLRQWRDGRLSQTRDSDLLLNALERLTALQQEHADASGPATRLARQRLHDLYLPATTMRHLSAGSTCWAGAQLTPDIAMTALFWLDILSVGNTLSLSSFEPRMQFLIMEAALNPRRTGQCLTQGYAGIETAEKSLFLQEIERDPDFVRFILRDIASHPLDISGANPLARSRFVQLRAGDKILEGAMPGPSSRLLMVGELGAVIERATGLEVAIYGRNLIWIAN